MEQKSSIFSILRRNSGLYLKGIKITLLLAIVGTLGAFGIALGIVYLKGKKQDRKKVTSVQYYIQLITDQLLSAYIFVIKGIPMMIQAMIFYYGIHALGEFKWLTPLNAGLIVITFNSTAYIAEIILRNVNFFDPAQIEAAQALGMTEKQTLRHVIFPQAIKRSLLPIMNEFIINLKDGSVLSVIGVMELFAVTKQIRGATFNTFATFTIAGVIYLILILFANIGLKILEKKLGTHK
ncbi:amino acid ABC transporter permease [Candidatus Phytoplasma pruni]|uniref:Amino acid ABC transporter permease n=1 Tax=Candidatus Phytoplasma pruni TaxID=479893 RepID=A0A851HH77_9MOLU|nr:amino acid ABC transporter permease [Candidatus Phytoplasma pruni]